jgi:hypothetical protein
MVNDTILLLLLKAVNDILYCWLFIMEKNTIYSLNNGYYVLTKKGNLYYHLMIVIMIFNNIAVWYVGSISIV